MRWRSPQILSILLVLVLVIAAAGCGKKNATSTTTTTVTETTATTTAASDTTTSPATTGAVASAANCKQLANLGQQFTQALSGAKGDVQKQAQLMKDFADKTPADIRPDFETLADAYTQVASALKGANLSNGQTPSGASLSKLLQLSQKIQDPKFQAALHRIETWAAKNCHS